MKVGYHPAVQKDVNRALRRYDQFSERLGNEFWAEPNKYIATAAANPLRFHRYLQDLRRANLKRFLTIFFTEFCRTEFASLPSATINNVQLSVFDADKRTDSRYSEAPKGRHHNSPGQRRVLEPTPWVTRTLSSSPSRERGLGVGMVRRRPKTHVIPFLPQHE
jgi:hypothetical protein